VLGKRPHTEARRGKKAGRMPASPVTRVHEHHHCDNTVRRESDWVRGHLARTGESCCVVKSLISISAGSTTGERCLRRSLTPEIRRRKKAGRMPASPVTGYTSTITEITL
jgi:hypothetical protein